MDEHLLELCLQHFPGVNWEVETNDSNFLCYGESGSFAVRLIGSDKGAICSILRGCKWIMVETPNQVGIIPELALAQAAKEWREFADTALGMVTHRRHPPDTPEPTHTWQGPID